MTKDKCKGCGQPVEWTGLYGDWCATCMPRDTTPSKKKSA